ncbi:acyltransferase domain-containing protein [Lederbergia panacisoli]|uniref:acyltransferase domain-containing protein n=1 Tax=Lederbergia panacisoli TaxID=1255251 RepID=UPI00214BBEDD|nr:acyltransferase domain-containing protein [Lederbergia panacisoli]MCR2822858.1 acyltransferase domain-containing protein [Lederbergia panacisoli]
MQQNRKNTRLIQSFHELMSLLHIQNPPEMWGKNWEKAIALYNGNQQLYFLRNEYFTEANRYFKLNEEKSAAFYHALELIRGREDLITLVWLWKCLLYEENSSADAYDVENWPLPEVAMGPVVQMFPLIVAVSNLPSLIENYKMRGIPESILFDTLSDIGIIMEESRKRTGVWGIENFLLGWLLNHFQGRLFRIGRLQFMPKKYDQRFSVYRHLNTRKVIALKSERRLTDNADFVKGCPITPLGKVLQKTVTISLAEWEAVLIHGDTMLDVHIPRGDKLEYNQLVESYRSAIAIYSKLFPEQQFKGFICHTWMFDPLLQEILPEDSNLVKFQRDYYLYELFDDDSVFQTVFVSKPEDLQTLPEETSLQRAIKSQVLSGKQMRSAAGFLLFDDLYSGPTYYQKNQGEVQSLLEACE